MSNCIEFECFIPFFSAKYQLQMDSNSLRALASNKNQCYFQKKKKALIMTVFSCYLFALLSFQTHSVESCKGFR